MASMSSQPQRRWTADEYLALERSAERRSEFLDGEIFTIAGASRRHALIVSNLVGELRAALADRRCLVFSSDLRLRVTPTGLYTYPDVMVACGNVEFADEQEDTLLNPALIIEVLSPSTEDWDRGGKFGHYRTIESVREYLLVEQQRPHLELYTRQTDGRWVFSETGPTSSNIELASLGLTLAIDAIYAKLDLLVG